MKIQDFTPTFVRAESLTKPYPRITLVFKTQDEAINFHHNFIMNSNLKLRLLKHPDKDYLLELEFPKQNNYKLNMKIQNSDNRVYKDILNKNLELTCGFMPTKDQIGALSPGYILDNNINLN
ncbi:MAG: hypothetical protein R2837_11350 [Aliarcobacter sp.]